jgi:hypothetical protein
MIAVSSHRAFSKSEEYAINQERAAKSWQSAFSNIYYYGHYEEGLDHENTLFVRKAEEWPTIREMAEFSSQLQAGYVALLNADIVVASSLSMVEKEMRAIGLPAATSYRYTFDQVQYPNLDGAVRNKEDRGMDIFVAKPEIWGMVKRDIPEYLRFGHPTWDTWVCGYFCEKLGYGFRHFTDRRCIFHPKHEGRLTPHNPEIRNDSPYFTLAKRPSPL